MATTKRGRGGARVVPRLWGREEGYDQAQDQVQRPPKLFLPEIRSWRISSGPQRVKAVKRRPPQAQFRSY